MVSDFEISLVMLFLWQFTFGVLSALIGILRLLQKKNPIFL